MGQPDHMEMDPGVTSDAMRLVAVAGDHMGSGWQAVSSGLDDLVGQLGRGELGAAFLDGYEPPAAETANLVEQCCQAPARLAGVGNQCAGEYGHADDRGRDTFDSLDATAPPADHAARHHAGIDL